MTAARRTLLAATIAFGAAVGVWSPAPLAQTTVPARLSDSDFWALVEDMSEPDGYFSSDNLVSNEDTFQFVVPELQRTVKSGGVYVGVGPDQNFTYISALRPSIAFIPDIRRGNLQMHLMYKVLMEQSPDRVTFLSKLFSRKRPEWASASATPQQLFEMFQDIPAAREMYQETLAGVLTSLQKQHGFRITEADSAGIAYILTSFLMSGPYLQYSSRPIVGRGGRYPSFAELQMATDEAGVPRAYLASEEYYQTVRRMQQNNLIVPLVGNFGGQKTLRAIGDWVRRRGARVTTFYTSNVEQYLFQDRLWDAFAANVAAMPLDDSSTLIRSCFNNCVSNYNSRVVMLLDSMQEMVKAHKAGLITNYFEVLTRRR
jgi:hypothetical protein